MSNITDQKAANQEPPPSSIGFSLRFQNLSDFLITQGIVLDPAGL